MDSITLGNGEGAAVVSHLRNIAVIVAVASEIGTFIGYERGGFRDASHELVI